MNHLIKRQVVELRLDKKMDAFRMQHVVSEHYRTVIVPILERVFDRVSTEDEVIALDKLEIDLGVFSRESMEQNQWSENLELKIEEQLETLKTVSGIKKDGTRLLTPISVCHQWLFYMKHGHLPWNTVEIDDQWYKNVLEALSVDFVSVGELRNLIAAGGQPLKRIVFQHPPRFLQQLAGILTAQIQNTLTFIIEDLYALQTFSNPQKGRSVASINEKDFKTDCWMQLLTFCTIIPTPTSAGALPARLIESFLTKFPLTHKPPSRLTAKLPHTWPLVFAQLKALGAEQTGRRNVEAPTIKTNPEAGDPSPGIAGDIRSEGGITIDPETAKTAISEGAEPKVDQQDVRNQQQEIVTPDTGKASDEHFADQVELTLNEQLSERPGNENIARDFSSKAHPGGFDSIDEEGIFVTNAGIVLLHPFLNALFKRVQLVSEGNFVNANAHQKALHLIHYMATGSLHGPEHTMVIAKLLCAYRLEETVEMDLEVESELLTEADDLLLAAIGQWSILKNTSPAGLREGFLQRAGKLFSKNGSLYLQIEQSSIDLLLDNLPWNLSMIRLPWMKDILRVEWR